MDDAWLLPFIRGVADSRPTYGNRRVGALLKREFTARGKPKVNQKRINQIMRQSSLLLTRHIRKGRQVPHLGKVL